MPRIVALLVLVAACAASDPERSAPAARTGEAEIQSLLEADRDFAIAAGERRLEGWVENFAEDGLQVGAAAVAEGRTAIRARMAPAFADPSFALDWTPEGARISADGSLGYTWGTYESRGGEGVVEQGRYLTIWRRQPDGRWLVEADIGTGPA